MKNIGLLVNLGAFDELVEAIRVEYPELKPDEYYWVFTPQNSDKDYLVEIVRIEENKTDITDPFVHYVDKKFRVVYSGSDLKTKIIVSVRRDEEITNNLLRIMKVYGLQLLEIGGTLQVENITQKINKEFNTIKKGINNFLSDE